MDPDHIVEAQPNYRTAEGKYSRYWLNVLYGPFKFVVIFGVVTGILFIPIGIIGNEPAVKIEKEEDIEAFFAQQRRFLIYYIFGWLLISWLGLALCYAIGTILPYIFRFVARYVILLRSLSLELANWRIAMLTRLMPVTGALCALFDDLFALQASSLPLISASLAYVQTLPPPELLTNPSSSSTSTARTWRSPLMSMRTTWNGWMSLMTCSSKARSGHISTSSRRS
jgi:hypothetical protein